MSIDRMVIPYIRCRCGATREAKSRCSTTTVASTTMRGTTIYVRMYVSWSITPKRKQSTAAVPPLDFRPSIHAGHGQPPAGEAAGHGDLPAAVYFASRRRLNLSAGSGGPRGTPCHREKGSCMGWFWYAGIYQVCNSVCGYNLITAKSTRRKYIQVQYILGTTTVFYVRCALNHSLTCHPPPPS